MIEELPYSEYVFKYLQTSSCLGFNENNGKNVSFYEATHTRVLRVIVSYILISVHEEHI